MDLVQPGGAPDPGERDINANGIADGGVLPPNAGLIVQIKPTASPNLLDLHVAACWMHRGRAISEDTDCDGVFDEDNNGILSVTEDPNQNRWVDSPVMVSTRVGRPE
jgi:hypothetical protein